MEDRDFSLWFRRELRSRDWDQADFVRRAGLSSSTVSQWASGKRRPTPDSCRVIADVLGMDEHKVLRVAGWERAKEVSADDEFRDQLKALIDGIPVSMLGPVRPMLQALYDEAQASRRTAKPPRALPTPTRAVP